MTADRRAALKQRHRQAIVDAAAALMREAGGVTFTVEELAERADVARRTVFNHFASVDDIVIAVCGDVLADVVDALVCSVATSTPATAERGAMVDELAHALRATDVVSPMAYLSQALGLEDDDSPWRAALLLRVFTDLGERLSAALAVRHPQADVLDIHLLVSAVTSGLVTLHQHWFAATGGADDAASRAVWARLLDRLLASVRDGHGGPPD